MSCGRALAGIALFCALQAHGAEEFKFDASEFRRKPFEFSGYVEAKQQQFKLNPDGAFYQINFYDRPRDRLDETTLTLKPSGKLRAGDSTLEFRAHLEGDWETRAFERTGRLDELFFSHKPTPGFTAELGKISKKCWANSRCDPSCCSSAGSIRPGKW